MTRTVEELIAQHVRDFHMVAPLPANPAAVRGIVAYFSDVERAPTLESLFLRESIAQVRDRMIAAHGFTYTILPIETADLPFTRAYGDEQEVDADGDPGFPRFFSEAPTFLGPFDVPTYIYVPGSRWAKLPNAPWGWAHSIGGIGKWCVGATAQPTIVMHELGHVWAWPGGHTGTPPREVRSWFGFGPPTLYYDIMSTNPIPYDKPLEQCEFNPYHVGFLKHSPHLKGV